jgi:predicted deacylase
MSQQSASRRFELPSPDLGQWRAGNTGVEGVWQFQGAQPGPQVMISALVHGNELCGAWAVLGLLQSGLRPQRGGLTLAFCNLAAFDRFDPAHFDGSRFVDEDLNRQWIPERLAAANTLERRRAAALRPFVEAADWLLDLHSMHEGGPPLLLAGVQPRNLNLARRLGSPGHIVIDTGHQDGVRMRDFGRFGELQDNGTHSLLIECGFHGDPASKLVAQDACWRFLQASGALDDAGLSAYLPGWLQPPAPIQWVLEVTDAVVARGDSFRFAQTFVGLDVVKKAGTVIGWNDGDPVSTPYDDCVLVMPSTRQARAGVTVVRFAHRRPA